VYVRDVQRLAWQNKVNKGFNTSDVPLEFGLLTAEVGEAFTAWRKDLPDFGDELADVALYLVAIAEMTGIDLESAIERKMARNAARVYGRDSRGVLVRISDPLVDVTAGRSEGSEDAEESAP
jgi:NTP pyrophosphatase (non-canonical NTP hydrolase)